jgi:hypothetical protein
MIYFVVPRGQEFGVLNYAEDRAKGLLDRLSILNYEDLGRTPWPSKGTYVLSALDQLTPEGLDFVREWCDHLRGEDPSVRILNDPRATMCRFELLNALYQLGLNQHRVVRPQDKLADLRFPVFVRNEHHHSGSLSPLLHTQTELRGAIAKATLLGHPRQDLLVVEFVETADDDGYYRKYAAHIIGEKIISRGLAVGTDWMLKAAGSLRTRSIVFEQRAYVMENPHEAELRRIFGIAKTEYGRIDYAIKDGRIETWEINLNPTLGRGVGPRPPRDRPPEVEQLWQEVQGYLTARFEEGFTAVDTPPQADSTMPPATFFPAYRRDGPMIRPRIQPLKSVVLLRRIPFFGSALWPLLKLLAHGLKRGIQVLGMGRKE